MAGPSKSTPKIATVDKNKCLGCGTCTVIAEESFKLGEDGKAEAILIKDDQGTVLGTQGEQEKIQEAIDSCPVQAISWEPEEKK
jgi:ferredoxin